MVFTIGLVSIIENLAAVKFAKEKDMDTIHVGTGNASTTVNTASEAN